MPNTNENNKDLSAVAENLQSNQAALQQATEKLKILDDLLGTSEIVELQEFVKEMFHLSITSPEAEQPLRQNCLFIYNLLEQFFKDLQPYCRFKGIKPAIKAEA